MNKLKEIVKFECLTSIKYILCFYAIQYSILLLLFFIDIMNLSGVDNIHVGGLESNTLIYIAIVVIIGFLDDFKLLIQCGFTRKYVFMANVSQFAFMSAFMAFVDTVVASILMSVLPKYSTLLYEIYGTNNILLNFLFLFVMYMLVCSIFYIVIILFKKLSKRALMIIGAIAIVLIMFYDIIFSFIPSSIIGVLSDFMNFILNFNSDGSVNIINLFLVSIATIVLVATIAYNILRHTELKVS